MASHPFQVIPAAPAWEAFVGMVVEVEPTTTAPAGDLDQAALRVMLDRVRPLGLELVDVRQAPSP